MLFSNSIVYLDSFFSYLMLLGMGKNHVDISYYYKETPSYRSSISVRCKRLVVCGGVVCVWCCGAISLKMNALARSSTIATAARVTAQAIPSGGSASPVLAERLIAAPAQPKLTSQIIRNAITPRCAPMASVGLGGKNSQVFFCFLSKCIIFVRLLICVIYVVV